MSQKYTREEVEHEVRRKYNPLLMVFELMESRIFHLIHYPEGALVIQALNRLNKELREFIRGRVMTETTQFLKKYEPQPMYVADEPDTEPVEPAPSLVL